MPSAPSPVLNAAETAILILGAPRSGTTWLAKIFDSHPEVMYRHEPDALQPLTAGATAETVRRAVAGWVVERAPRSAGKRPFFRKAGQSGFAFLLRGLLATASAIGARLPLLGAWIGRCPIPDLAPLRRVVIKSVDWAEGARLFASAIPNGRVVIILRHPCGQVASVMRGAANRRFDLRQAETDMPFDEDAARAVAARHGVDATAFASALPAARYAWGWVAFNETALAALDVSGNVRVIVYETLCADPSGEARSILAFAGLEWDRQTEEFLARSTSDAASTGYYAVFRDSLAAAGRWRTSMAEADQAAVRDVVRRTRLAAYWPDLAGG